jgi:hypothetical protein
MAVDESLFKPDVRTHLSGTLSQLEPIRHSYPDFLLG